MSKSSNFFGQPIYGQLIKSLNRDKIVEISRKHGGEKYVKSFDGYTHLLTMLYAVIQRFDSLREIETSMTAEVRKLHHVGINSVPRRSTLSDANARRSEKFFEEVYRDLYAANKDILSSDSRRNGTEEWIKQLRIIDSTTITLFSNAIFKGVGRHPKTGKKKGGIKVHSVIHANEGHNFVYLANYIKAKYWKSSIEDEAHMAKMVKDIIDNADCPGGCIFRKWLSECDETGTLIDWDEIL